MLDNFRAIIVGGGPVGLSAAHALRLAGIDFLLLEQRPTVVEGRGAGIALTGNSLRVLHQFGVLDALRPMASEIAVTECFDMSGRRFRKTDDPGVLKTNNGAGLVGFIRSEFLEVLYHGLPPDDREKILTQKKVVDIASEATGVSVTCSDGTAYTGSIIIGADGVHSPTRHAMRRLALSEDPKREWDPENPFVAEYNVVWCVVPHVPQPDAFNTTQHPGRGALYFPSKSRSCIFMYEKLPEPTSQRARYTKEDIEEQGAKFAGYKITGDHTVGDVFDPRVAGMTNMDEGLARHWNFGRIVLVGDSCHKMSPNVGQGYQAGLADVVVLANRLRRALRAAPGVQPDIKTLGAVFDEYQEARRIPLKRSLDISQEGIRLHTWASWKHYILARYVIPWNFVSRRVGEGASQAIAGAPVLDYVPTSEPFNGLVGWRRPMPEASDAEALGPPTEVSAKL